MIFEGERVKVGRKRAFDKEVVLDKAMRLFWTNGYSGTSVANLSSELGINTSSLYGTFGNKEQLFQDSLAHYVKQYVEANYRHLIEPSDATLKLFGFLGQTADLFVVKGNTATDGALVPSDYEPLGWTTGADNSSNVTKYSDEVESWIITGYNDITLRPAALTSMVDDDVIKFCLIESTKDLPNSAMTSDEIIRNGMYYQDSSGTSEDPILNYTVAVAGYTHNVNGIDSGDISKINGIATSDISKINGV